MMRQQTMLNFITYCKYGIEASESYQNIIWNLNIIHSWKMLTWLVNLWCDVKIDIDARSKQYKERRQDTTTMIITVKNHTSHVTTRTVNNTRHTSHISQATSNLHTSQSNHHHSSPYNHHIIPQHTHTPLSASVITTYAASSTASETSTTTLRHTHHSNRNHQRHNHHSPRRTSHFKLSLIHIWRCRRRG